MQHIGSPVHIFAGFPDPICEAGALTEQYFSDSVLCIMLRFLNLWIRSPRTLTNRPRNCHAQAPVDCNPVVLDALRCDAKKTDHHLQDVSKDILQAAIIVTKSLLVLDKVAQDGGLPEVARAVCVLNGALALLGNANYKSNLARRFAMKHEINHNLPSKLQTNLIAKKLTSAWLLRFAFVQEFHQVAALWSAAAQG
ncbi:hypothetical protein E2C01_029014 [Portunus trituberculatus]|uniref:Uncharacterized protein n=1 Tax=Portunus trituberculatus TaxID=210409 RepID=A0A5B7ER37_PORTR|nr:hypothetical protein [Portunus trituberculatus]